MYFSVYDVNYGPFTQSYGLHVTVSVGIPQKKRLGGTPMDTVTESL